MTSKKTKKNGILKEKAKVFDRMKWHSDVLGALSRSYLAIWIAIGIHVAFNKSLSNWLTILVSMVLGAWGLWLLMLALLAVRRAIYINIRKCILPTIRRTTSLKIRQAIRRWGCQDGALNVIAWAVAVIVLVPMIYVTLYQVADKIFSLTVR